jgi:mycothiol system anti-sigma-R factor
MRDEQEHTPATAADIGGEPHQDAAMTPAVPHYHETDCSEFLLRIYEYMDGEMGPEENLRFEAHVRECRPCLQQHRVDETVKGLIRRVAPQPVAPETLRASIMARITTFRLESHG